MVRRRVDAWTEEDKNTLARMFIEGARSDDVAMKLGRSAKAVNTMASRMSLIPKYKRKVTPAPAAADSAEVTSVVTNVINEHIQQRQEVDPELDAILVIVRAFEELEDAARDRVFTYVRDRFAGV